MENITEQIRKFYGENKTISYVLIFFVALFLLPIGKLIKPKRRVKRRKPVVKRVRNVRRSATKAGFTKSVTGKMLRVPSGKKPWQVKGSQAAKNRMSKIRKMRR